MKFLSLKTREPQNLEVSGNFVAEILVIHFFSRFCSTQSIPHVGLDMAPTKKRGPRFRKLTLPQIHVTDTKPKVNISVFELVRFFN